MSAKDGIFKETARAGLAALVGAMLLAVPALAATAPVKAAKAEAPASRVTTPAQRCAALEKQFDDGAKGEADGRNLAAAKKLRTEGGHLCEVGRHAAGALRLSRALAEIGLKAREP
jgi:hypothetical protein